MVIPPGGEVSPAHNSRHNGIENDQTQFNQATTNRAHRLDKWCSNAKLGSG